MPDAFTFEDDLDSDLPADMRAGLTVQDDGEHIVFGMSLAGGGGDSREIYLTPYMAANLASLLDALTGAEDDDDEPSPGARAVSHIIVLGLCMGALLGLVYGVVALVAVLS